MKKYLFGILTVFLLFILSACQTQPNTSDTISTSSSKQTSTTTAVTEISTTKKSTTTKTSTTTTTQKKTSTSKKISTTSTNKPLIDFIFDEDLAENEKSWLDPSKLTFTQADVGKVVGWDFPTKSDVTVVKVEEEYDELGLKSVRAILSTHCCPSGFGIARCNYCLKIPCPNGGKESCPKYDIKKDGSKTCQQCGRLYGDGYNNTCYGEIDWANGGKLICNHYD
ncbi:MAG: hypothetical protein IJC17_02965 [Clostridia bacterium]|nr:hypothetical protein [Clostridia bacterium]